MNFVIKNKIKKCLFSLLPPYYVKDQPSPDTDCVNKTRQEYFDSDFY